VESAEGRHVPRYFGRRIRLPEGGRVRAPRAEPFGVRLRRTLWSKKVIVHDDSMLPNLKPGDRLLVDPGAFRDRPPAYGDLVVLRDPEAPERLLVKRIGMLATDRSARGQVFVVGDNPPHSRDSRAFGAVPYSALVGRVYRCYYPAERARDL
jgi:nickel-type superoxide dismutase maturation protease